MSTIRKGIIRYTITVIHKNGKGRDTFVTNAEPKIENGFLHIQMPVNPDHGYMRYGWSLSELESYTIERTYEELP